MSDTSVLANLVLLLVAASAACVLSVWLKQPVILGYLVAGVILGPFTPGPEADEGLLRLLTSALIVRLFGYATPVAVLSGLFLAQIGEFAFILANVGLQRGAISEDLFSVIIGAAVITIFANSLLLDSAPRVLAFVAKATGFPLLVKQPISAMASTVKRGRLSVRKRMPRRKH